MNIGDARLNIPSLNVNVNTWIFDPPYNVGFKYQGGVDDSLPIQEYENLIETTARMMYDKTEESGSCFLIHYPIDAARLMPIFERVGWKVHQWISWVYPHNMGMSSRKFTQGSRVVLWFVKGEPYVNIKAVKGSYRNPNDRRVKERIAQGHAPALMDWWQINLRKNVSKGHRGYANSLPPELVKRCILTTTQEGDIVGDPMAGSGTTLEVAHAYDRFVWLNDVNCDALDLWNQIIEA